MDKKISLLVPERKKVLLGSITEIKKTPNILTVFDDRTVNFFDEFSRQILEDNSINRIPEATALAFWLRKGNIKRIISDHIHLQQSDKYRVFPKGLVFHICPSNVDTLFLYSLSLALLMGNKNILRISSKDSLPQVNYLFRLLNRILHQKTYGFLKDYLQVISYEHDDEINRAISDMADMRIIWGGDDTIMHFKTLSTNPLTKDIVFPDRISYTLCKAQNFLKLDQAEKERILQDFYNDAYTFDQLACSAPQVLLIYGEMAETEKFISEFYRLLNHKVVKNYHTDTFSLALLKYNQLVDDVLDDRASSFITNSNKLTFTELNDEALVQNSCGAGYFYYKRIRRLSDIVGVLNEKVQTLSYIGLDDSEIDTILELSRGIGIDRIVPIGASLTFDYIWDGYNLVEELCAKKRIIKSRIGVA